MIFVKIGLEKELMYLEDRELVARVTTLYHEPHSFGLYSQPRRQKYVNTVPETRKMSNQQYT